MNGAESLVRTLLASGIDTCFANPGTSEMHFVAALDRIPGMKCVLGLQENIVTGMADGFWRVARRPAATLLHCGPGLANGMANLHNARRGRSGVVNCVGDQATFHRPFDAPLTADTEVWARGVSQWVRTSTRAEELGADAAAAVQAANAGAGKVATLILPADVCWNEGGVSSAALPASGPQPVDPEAVGEVARVLRSGGRTLVLLGGLALQEEAQRLAHDIACATGARLMIETFNGCVQRGLGRLPLERVPYPVDQAIKELSAFDNIVLVNARDPVGSFAYPGKPSLLRAEGSQVFQFTDVDQDAVGALALLRAELNAQPTDIQSVTVDTGIPSGKPTPEGFARVLASVLPEHAIVADESVSFGRGFFALTASAPAHDWLQGTGGAIGCGPPLATGAAVAGNGRRVINLQADGSAMFTVQALWTQAREKLPVTTVIISNRQYAILHGEYRNVGATPGPTAIDMLNLSGPDINWVKMAGAMGVEAAAAATLEEVRDLLKCSFKRPGPFLIEMVV